MSTHAEAGDESSGAAEPIDGPAQPTEAQPTPAQPAVGPPPRPDLPEVAPLTGSDTMDAQGWYLDPFQAHQARWFSAGRPTALVRDDGVEASDEPPHAEWDGPLELVHDDEGFVADEMARVENPPHPRNVTEGSGSMGIGFT